jgi:hypothetical protein
VYIVRALVSKVTSLVSTCLSVYMKMFVFDLFIFVCYSSYAFHGRIRFDEDTNEYLSPSFSTFGLDSMIESVKKRAHIQLDSFLSLLFCFPSRSSLLIDRCRMSSSTEELIELVKKLKRERSFILAEQKHIQEQYAHVNRMHMHCTHVERVGLFSCLAFETCRTCSTSSMDNLSSTLYTYVVDLSSSVRTKHTSKSSITIYTNAR